MGLLSTPLLQKAANLPGRGWLSQQKATFEMALAKTRKTGRYQKRGWLNVGSGAIGSAHARRYQRSVALGYALLSDDLVKNVL